MIGLPNTSSYTGGTQWSVAGFDLGSATNYIFNAYSNNIQFKDDFGWVQGPPQPEVRIRRRQQALHLLQSVRRQGSVHLQPVLFTRHARRETRSAQPRRRRRAPTGGLEFADYLLGAYSSTTLIIKQIPYVGPSAVSGVLRAGFLARHQQADLELRPALRILEPVDSAPKHHPDLQFPDRTAFVRAAESERFSGRQTSASAPARL